MRKLQKLNPKLKNLYESDKIIYKIKREIENWSHMVPPLKEGPQQRKIFGTYSHVRLQRVSATLFFFSSSITLQSFSLLHCR